MQSHQSFKVILTNLNELKVKVIIAEACMYDYEHTEFIE